MACDVWRQLSRVHRWKYLICVLTQRSLQIEVDKLESRKTLQPEVSIPKARVIETRAVASGGDQADSKTSEGGFDEIASETEAVRKKVVRRLVDRSWISWAHTVREDPPEGKRIGHPWRSAYVAPALLQQPGEYRVHRKEKLDDVSKG